MGKRSFLLQKKKKKDTTNFSSVHRLLSLTSKFKQCRNVYPGLVFANLTSCREEFVYLCLYKYIKFDLEIKSIKNSMRKKSATSRKVLGHVRGMES